jgi:hypothetical protein
MKFSVSSPFVSIDLWWFMGETRTSHGSHGSQGKHWRQRCHHHLPSRLLRPRLLWPRLQLPDWPSSVQAGPTAWLLNQGFLYHDYHQTRGFIWFNHEQWGYNGDVRTDDDLSGGFEEVLCSTTSGMIICPVQWLILLQGCWKAPTSKTQ